MSKTVKPYEAEGSKKQQVSTMFDRIAPYYDFLNRLLSLGIDTIWRKKAINLLKADQPQRILDVATGTADVAIEAAHQLSPEEIIGVDISVEMLEVGRKKVQRKGLQEIITLEEGDSENLPFPDNTFDALTVAFGVRNFENLERGLREMQRVLKPGGKVVILEFSRPTIFPFRQLYHFYFKNILPFIGKFTSKDPKAYRYLYESVQAFPDGDKFLNILSQTGYKSNRCIPLTLGVCSIYLGEK
ncbi:bifunctional demethylmenaquinone methyltransferase/2-methoxy-6-polyprenyl-1,4-benzoquinol methylase UbiE [Flavilitoribacter nigricans]|uniref:Demethylmenaquinone methyltransferase n=1 Tax=Flavilitoribacter nigricans (strain ATCC 23147 / DSM 23189 / NBRC 102662 / NCIMB 1420 / SS-2) TaxID=1122177 RepID=A0A2D0N9Q1_FLAN2|nr:bifunctional demethylmenaquinone methyltransferase/2-methoxy-6-polyprenyl-1,4-benzoquinol methylase UbiE [Flavilitoribacter nigricans]PHN05251.1 bifunctional demethylmenaquinone methyltransferase/2-methoxy-6-polyprenyl-1,4-benzoquinol methylase UbiE [Flavilitoribacter nigricans DSM 23189 = NBRC 102662]